MSLLEEGGGSVGGEHGSELLGGGAQDAVGQRELKTLTLQRQNTWMDR